MTEEKMILNDGQYDLDIQAHKVSVSADVLADKGWHKLANDEQIVKKVELTKEEAEFVEKNNALEFLTSNLERSFSTTAITYAFKQPNKNDVYTRLIQSYFNGYIVEKEPKYYINLGFDFSRYLNIQENGDWWWANETPLGQSQFTQDEIDEMQKDQRAKGLDLNALKVEVPEDELED